MAEERFGSIFVARTEDASNTVVNESRPAIKSHTVDRPRASSLPTSGAMSPDVVSDVKRPDASGPARRATQGRASEAATYQEFRRICDELLVEAKRADNFLVDGLLSDTGMELVVEVEELLDRLYGIERGKHECLKRIVVAIGSQLYNVQWTRAHIGFLKDVVRLLRSSYLIDDSLVEECLRLIRSHGLEVFRGTVTETEVRKKYRIIEVE
jgi:hypothetical protein